MSVGAVLSVVGMGGIVLGILVWQEGGEAVGALLAIGAVAMAALAWWLVRRKREGKPTLIDPDLFRSKIFRFGISGQMLQQIALGGTMIVLPIYLQMVLEYNAMQAGLSLAPLSLSMFAVALLAGKRAGKRRPASIIRVGFVLLTIGIGGADPDRAAGGLRLVLVVPLIIAGSGSGPAGVAAQQLHAVPDLGGAGQRGRRRQLGGRVVRAVVRAGVRRRHHAGHALPRASPTWREASTVLPPAEQQQVADALEDDAEVMSNTQLEELLAGQPQAIQDEIIRINTDARPSALQVALLIPILAGLLGLFTSFRMMRLPDPAPSGSAEGMAFG